MVLLPRGSISTTIMELSTERPFPIMVLGTYSIMVVSMDWVGGLTWASPASSGNEVWVRGVSSTVAPTPI